MKAWCWCTRCARWPNWPIAPRSRRSTTPSLHYVPTVTREPFPTPERGGDLFRSGALSQRLGLPAPDPEQDRVMICGNPAMTRELTHYLKDAGWTLTNHRGVGNFTTEIAFVVHHE